MEERRLTPCHALFATFIGAFHESGILTQGIVNLVASKAAEILYGYLTAMNAIKQGEHVRVSELFDSVLRALDWGEWEISEEGDELVLRIETNKCKYCPRGVGRAPLPSTACPPPKLLEKLAQLHGEKVAAEAIRKGAKITYVEKIGDKCIIRYRLGA